MVYFSYRSVHVNILSLIVWSNFHDWSIIGPIHIAILTCLEVHVPRWPIMLMQHLMNIPVAHTLEAAWLIRGNKVIEDSPSWLIQMQRRWDFLTHRFHFILCKKGWLMPSWDLCKFLHILRLRWTIVWEVLRELTLVSWDIVHVDLDAWVQMDVSHRELLLHHGRLWRSECCRHCLLSPPIKY